MDSNQSQEAAPELTKNVEFAIRCDLANLSLASSMLPVIRFDRLSAAMGRYLAYQISRFFQRKKSFITTEHNFDRFQNMLSTSWFQISDVPTRRFCHRD